MPDGADGLTLSVHTSIGAIPAAAWDACAGTDNPFVQHAFLAALEDSGSVSAETGWLPQHVTLHDPGGGLAGCAPLYLKSHSFGEYVFDWGWADAYRRAGGSYYPKLQCAVPFTPVTGPRLMVRPGVADPAGARRMLLHGMLELARRHEVSSLHITFPTATEYRELGDAGLLQRIGQQYHWENRGYADFDAFLATLTSRKRKALRKERAKANSQGVRFRTLTGSDLEERHWDAFHAFYLSTVDRKWARAYLSREFFSRLGATMADRIALVLGETEADGTPVCGALNLIGTDTLYGRNWGAAGAYRFLHFEACYYRAMDFAIDRGLRWVEAGAQGEHKIQRGYLPRATYSAHWIADPGFRRAVARFLDQESELVTEDMSALTAMGPYRKDGTTA